MLSDADKSCASFTCYASRQPQTEQSNTHQQQLQLHRKFFKSPSPSFFKRVYNRKKRERERDRRSAINPKTLKMGCVSSKSISRSTNFQDDKRAMAKGVMFAASNKNSDKFLDLVCPDKLHSQQDHIVNFALKDADLEIVSEKARISLKGIELDRIDGSERWVLAAEGLEPLRIPTTTAEFTAVGSLREWLHGGGEMCSAEAGEYVTPKFGSYSSEIKNVVFNAELVIAIEEHMQQLELEEETILKQISENWQTRSS